MWNGLKTVGIPILFMLLIPAFSNAGEVSSPREWVESLQKSAKLGNPAIFTEIKKVDPEFSPMGSDIPPLEFNQAQAFQGYMGASGGPSAVVQVIWKQKQEPNSYEEDQAIWIGIFRKTGSHWLLVKSLFHNEPNCLEGGSLLVVFGFTQKKSGVNAKLWVEKNSNTSCGSCRSGEYEKTLYWFEKDVLKSAPDKASRPSYQVGNCG